MLRIMSWHRNILINDVNGHSDGERDVFEGVVGTTTRVCSTELDGLIIIICLFTLLGHITK